MSKRIVWLELTEQEAKDLLTLAEEGETGILTAEDAIAGYLDGDSSHAESAIAKLRTAITNAGKTPKGLGPWSLR